MMVWKWFRVGAMLAAFLMLDVLGNPVRRASGDPEARRRSAIDRSMIRFGRSYPAEPSAAEIRELMKQPIKSDTDFNRVGRSKPDFLRFGRAQPDFLRFGKAQPDFIRFGRSQPSVSDEEIASVLEQYYGDESVNKREPAFLRFGRDISFDSGEKKSYQLFAKGPKIDKGNKFIRLGRSGEEDGDDESYDEERRKRSACNDCN